MESKAVADATVDDRSPPDVTLTDRRRPGRVDYQDAQLIALPYHLWANRAPGSMQVWVAELEG